MSEITIAQVEQKLAEFREQWKVAESKSMQRVIEYQARPYKLILERKLAYKKLLETAAMGKQEPLLETTSVNEGSQ